MALSRTARLVARALAFGTCAIVASCGFTGVGAGPSSGLEGAAGPADGAAGDGNPAFTDGGVIVVGGEGGAGDADIDGGAPDGAADGSSSTCPSACTSCTGTTCNILCDATHTCPSPITCPPGVPCHVTCGLPAACAGRTISCTQASSCLVDCTQFQSCHVTNVDCGIGPCRVDCTNKPSACVSVTLGAASAASLCLTCGVFSGQPGCTDTDGTIPAGKPCALNCPGGGCNANGNGLNGCPQTSPCP